MTHPRQDIRDAIVTMLSNGNTSAGTNVFSSRIKPITEANVPAINVQTFRENATLFNETKRIYRRILTVGIAVIDRANNDLDDKLDQIADQVESIILKDETLGGVASDTKLSDTNMRLELGDNTIGGVIISFDVEYYTEHQQEFDEQDSGDFEALHYALRNKEAADNISETTVSIPT